MADTVLRSIVLPISGPVDTDWEDLRDVLRHSWGLATAAANWMMTELYRRDVRRELYMEKLPKMPRVYLYPEARERWPDLPSQTVSTLEREVGRKYREHRYHVIWTGKRSLPTYRYPTPLPLPRQMWRLEPLEDGQRYGISLRLIDRRLTLQFRGGPHLRRARRIIEQIEHGELDAGAAYLYEKRSHSGDHRTDSQPMRRLMCRLSVRVPKRTPRGLAGTMTVRTGPHALLTAIDSGEIWRDHMDHVRRALIRFGRLHQTLADDMKAERRRPKRQADGIRKRMGDIARRRRNMVDSGMHEVVAHVVGWAKRRRVAEIQYDDRDKNWYPEFPWYELAQRLKQKCELEGIEFRASGAVAEDTGQALAQATTSTESKD